jgi:hypothetical protein
MTYIVLYFLEGIVSVKARATENDWAVGEVEQVMSSRQTDQARGKRIEQKQTREDRGVRRG